MAGSGPAPDLSVIIVSWNTRELLQQCLETLIAHTTGVTFDVYVIDNDSADKSADMVAAAFPQVHLIRNRENAGFSRANNQGIRASRGRYVALLNPDTRLIEDVFTPLVRHADAVGHTAAVGPKILNRDEQTVQYVCARNEPNLFYDFCRMTGLERRFPRSRLFGGEYMTYWAHDSQRRVEGLCGACMVVNREAIEEAGLMDEDQFLYSDEIEWCMRFRSHGWHVRYYPEAQIVHYGEESTRQTRHRAALEIHKSRWNLYRKHRGAIYAAVFCMQVAWISACKYCWYRFAELAGSGTGEMASLNRTNVRWSLRMLAGRE